MVYVLCQQFVEETIEMHTCNCNMYVLFKQGLVSAESDDNVP